MAYLGLEVWLHQLFVLTCELVRAVLVLSLLCTFLGRVITICKQTEDNLLPRYRLPNRVDPSSELVRVLYALKKYMEVIVSKRRALKKPLLESVQNAVVVRADCGVLKCTCTNQLLELLNLVCANFLSPVLTNYALSVMGKNDLAKAPHSKPLSRNSLRLSRLECAFLDIFSDNKVLVHSITL